MPGDLAAEQPAAVFGLLMRDGVELRAGDIRVRREPRLDRIEHHQQVGAQPALGGVRADRIAAPDIRLPIAEHRAEIEKDDIVLRNDPIGGGFPGDTQSIDPGPHDAIVPMLGHAEIARRDGEDVALDLQLGTAGGDDPGGLDRVEQRQPPTFGSDKLGEGFVPNFEHVNPRALQRPR